ncbi:MAG: O-antigen ligase family protein [Armatimonadetes bacterium]|nr:O-antigen ligase family protein [Armatimonadota bacterium]
MSTMSATQCNPYAGNARRLVWLYLPLIVLGCTYAYGFAAYPPYAVMALVGLLALVPVLLRTDLVVVSLFFLILMGRLQYIDAGGQLTVSKIVVALVGVIWLGKMIITRDGSPLRQAMASPVSICLYLFLIVSFISFINVTPKALTYSVRYYMRGIFLLMMYWLMVHYIRTSTRFKQAMALMVIAGVLVCFMGFYEVKTHKSIATLVGRNTTLISGGDAGLETSIRTGPTANVTGIDVQSAMSKATGAQWARPMTTFVDSNHMALSLVGILGYTIALFLIAGSKRMRGWLAMAMLVMIPNILCTGSRTGLACMLLLILLLIAMSKLRGKIPIGITFLAVAACVMLLFPDTMKQFRKGVTTDDPRSGLWHMALSMVREHPLVGVGPGNFVYRYMEYRLPYKAPKAYMVRFTAGSRYMTVLAENGIFGLLAWLALMFSSIYVFYRYSRYAPTQEWRDISKCLFAVTICYALMAVVHDFQYDQSLWELFVFATVLPAVTAEAEKLPEAQS